MYNTVITAINPGASTYTESFTSETSVSVAHSLGYKPLIQVEDNSGNGIDFAYQHTDSNNFTITFAIAQTGVISYK